MKENIQSSGDSVQILAFCSGEKMRLHPLQVSGCGSTEIKCQVARFSSALVTACARNVSGARDHLLN